MEYLILGILGIGGGIVTLLGWLWLSAERDLSKTRREIDKHESVTRRLAEELGEIKQMFVDYEKQLHGGTNRDYVIANQQVRLCRDIAVVRRKLDESKSKMSELDEAKRARPAVQASDGGDVAALVRLNDRMAELKQELADGEAKLRELDIVLEKLTEEDPMRQALGEANAPHQVQLERLRERNGASGAGELRPASIQEQFDELLTMQAAFAEAQRRFHNALVTFDGLIDIPSKTAVQTPTFEVFTRSGAKGQPISTGNAPDSETLQSPVKQSDAQQQRGIQPKLRNLKPPKAG